MKVATTLLRMSDWCRPDISISSTMAKGHQDRLKSRYRTPLRLRNSSDRLKLH